MALIAVAGSSGAPGATTTALALMSTWPLEPGYRVILAECDPDGGDVVVGALAGRTPGGYGMRNLALAARTNQLSDAFWRQLIDLSETEAQDRLLLPGLTDPAQASSMQYAWNPLTDLLLGIEHTTPSHDVIADLGRHGGTGPSSALVRRADLVLVVVRSTLRGVYLAEPRVRALVEDLEAHGTGQDALQLLVVRSGPYSAGEVADRLGVPVLAELPDDPRAAAVLSDGDDAGRRFPRSDLMRHAASAADRVRAQVTRRRVRLAPRSANPPAHPASAASNQERISHAG
ncbi:MAG: hypothetical protein JO362_01705 [Streptomycetaceae bacterium]|nr:hypothetical protein [Streptomycetaceae bacterium]